LTVYLTGGKSVKENPVGSVFEMGGKRVEVVETHSPNCCHYCAFSNPKTNEEARPCVSLRCEPGKRDDCKCVRYREIK